MTMCATRLFAALVGASLLVNAGTRAQAPTLLLDLVRGSGSSYPSQFFERPNGETWFTAWPGGATAPALFVTDGTAVNTRKLIDLHALHIPSLVFADDWKAWFVQYSDAHGFELWRSDGTTRGTTLHVDFNAGPLSSLPRSLTTCGPYVYHSAYDEEHGYELCRNGQRIADIRPGPLGSNPSDFVRCGNFLFFSADDGVRGRELWALQWRDPQNANPAPRLVADVRPGPESSDPVSLVPFQNNLFFVADDGVAGRELWRSDGSGSGTRLVKDIAAGGADGIPDAALTLTTSRLFFVGDDGQIGRELWFSNGTASGTNPVADLRPGPEGSDPRDLTVMHTDRVAFSADDGVHGRELWWSTAVAATLVDLVPGPASSDPVDLFFSSNNLYLGATDPATGTEPWLVEAVDLLSPGRLADLRPGSFGSRPAGGFAFAIALRHVILRADDGTHGTEAFVIDGGGLSRSFGQGCGGELRQPSLRTTAPRLGANLQIDGSGLQTLTPSVAAVFLSAKPSFPIPLGLCELQLDPITLQLLGALPITGSNRFSLRLFLPDEASLLGLTLTVGATYIPSSDPFLGFDLTNIADLRLGR